MEWLPEDYEGSWTLDGITFREGIGLHSGEKTFVELAPSSEPGFHVSWINNCNPPITLEPNQVINSQLCTSLQLGDNKLSTVEHLLSAVVGCGLTHLQITVNGEEIPLLDGSALPWVNAIREVGLRAVTGKPRCRPVINQSLIIHQGNSVISVTPNNECKLIAVIDFPYSVIGQQSFSIDLSPRSFVEQIAPARTFGFKDQLETLRAKGLIKGGSLENSLVCDHNKWLNPPLRFKEEPVRHKLLDLIGDLALVGLPKAQVLVYRGSHALHAKLASALQQACPSSKCSLD